MHKSEFSNPSFMLQKFRDVQFNGVDLFIIVLRIQFYCKLFLFSDPAPVLNTDIYRDPMLYASCSMKFPDGSMTGLACDESASDATC